MKKKFGVTLSFTLDVEDTPEGEETAHAALILLTEGVRDMVRESYPPELGLKNTVISTQEYPND